MQKKDELTVTVGRPVNDLILDSLKESAIMSYQNLHESKLKLLSRFNVIDHSGNIVDDKLFQSS